MIHKRMLFKIRYIYSLFFKNKVEYLDSYYGVKLSPNFGDQTFKYCIRGDYGDFLSNYIRSIKFDFVFIDIGANQGLYSIISNQNLFCRKIYSIEPQKKIISILKKTLK
jgi:hypothetical protein